MAKERGWWELKTTVEPTESDLEHIAEVIKEGFTSGEITKDDDEDEQDMQIAQPVSVQTMFP